MSNNQTLEELVRAGGDHLGALIRRAYELGERAGEQRGIENARARVLRALEVPEGVAGEPEAVAEAIAPPTRRGRAASAASATGTIHQAMTSMEIGPNGVGPRDVTEYVNRTTEWSLTQDQVRTGLKVLARRGKLRRVTHGKYVPAQAAPAAGAVGAPAVIADTPREAARPDPRPAAWSADGAPFLPSLSGSVSPFALMSVEGAKVN